MLGSAYTSDHAGFVLSTSAADGAELWRVVLAMEDGQNRPLASNTRGQMAVFLTKTFGLP